MAFVAALAYSATRAGILLRSIPGAEFIFSEADIAKCPSFKCPAARRLIAASHVLRMAKRCTVPRW